MANFNWGIGPEGEKSSRDSYCTPTDLGCFLRDSAVKPTKKKCMNAAHRLFNCC